MPAKYPSLYDLEFRIDRLVGEEAGLKVVVNVLEDDELGFVVDGRDAIVQLAVKSRSRHAMVRTAILGNLWLYT